nr:hypothetical protein [Mammaliicoccus sp. Marseille-Q6498]
MKKAIKPFLILVAIVLIFVLIVIIFFRTQDQLMKEKDAKNLVTERYKGTISKLTKSKDNRTFFVKIKDSEKIYSLEIDRRKETIKNVNSQSTAKKQNTKKNNKTKEKPKKPKKKNELISEDRAKQIVMNEVGGTFVSIKKNKNTTPETYSITQHVDDDEGAIVSVNTMNGKVHSVTWFNIEQSQSNANQQPQNKNQYYYENDDEDDDFEYEDDDD